MGVEVWVLPDFKSPKADLLRLRHHRELLVLPAETRNEKRIQERDWLLETGYWKLMAGNWLLETGYWKRATGNWRLETGGWKPATGY